MSWITALEQLAPTVASALGTPVAGMAVAALESALGISGDQVQKTIEDNKLTGEQVAAIQAAEINLKAQAQQLGLNFEQLAVDDRKSAREMQIATKSWIPGALAMLIVSAWILIQYFLLNNIVPQEMRELIARILGTLDSALMLVLSYYFGSSKGSQDKDQLLYNSSPTK
jgi:hypothetical protein